MRLLSAELFPVGQPESPPQVAPYGQPAGLLELQQLLVFLLLFLFNILLFFLNKCGPPDADSNLNSNGKIKSLEAARQVAAIIQQTTKLIFI